MVTAFDVEHDKLINSVKEKLKKSEFIEPTDWSRFVKSGRHVERVPAQEDFWYIRAASILRKLYIHGPKGVQRLRRMYGGRKNRGVKPEKSYKAGGKIIRTILQQLEKEGLITKVMRSGRKGRELTPKAIKLLDNTAHEIKTKK